MNDQGSEASPEARLIEALRRTGPQSFEALSSASGLSFNQVFLAVDRMSRSGEVIIRRLPCSEYQITVGKRAM